MRMGFPRFGRWFSRPSRWLRGVARHLAAPRRRWLVVAALFALGMGGGLAGSRVWLSQVKRSAAPARLELQTAAAPAANPSAATGQFRVGPAGAGMSPAVGAVRPGGETGPAADASPGGGGTGGFTLGRDTMRWPADGLLLSTAGWRRHPTRGDWSYQPGLELAVPSGAPVRAAAAGTVTEVAVGSDGYTVVVDHGGGWTTVYGRLSEVRVRTGQGVRAGAVLGAALSLPDAMPAMAAGAPATGWDLRLGSPLPGRVVRATVTFEVRRGGESVEPLRLLGPGWFRVAPEGSEAAAAGEGLGAAAQASPEGYPVPGP